MDCSDSLAKYHFCKDLSVVNVYLVDMTVFRIDREDSEEAPFSILF